MADLSTRYLGLDLPNPVIVGSSGLTNSVEKVLKCAEAGAGGVVLKSIFEEQILQEVDELADVAEISYWHAEAADYIHQYGRENAVGEYVKLIKAAKAAVDIPIIASVHCVSAGAWTEFAMRAEQVGADASELNVHVFPSDPRRSARDNEEVYLRVAEAVKRKVSIPVALKIGFYFSDIPEMAAKLAAVGVDGLVFFNRFYRIDFDIEGMEMVAASYLSSPDEITIPLRWISLLSGELDCDFAATTGVHDGPGAVKMLLAGAKAVQICSILYRQGVGHIGTILGGVTDWMERHGFSSIDEFRGKLCQELSENPAAYERVQFMKLSAGEE